MSTDREFDALITELCLGFKSRAAEHDANDSFVADNYEALRKAKVFSAAVPKELGGRGISHRQMSATLRTIGRACGSTALSLSMHQHLLAAQTYNHLHGKPGRKVLEKVAADEIVLVSTGAGDWLASNGTLERVPGGYRFTARKVFASGCPAGALLMTSGVYQDPQAGPQVLHFPVPFSAEGVRIENDWQVLGMRATGSHTVSLKDVFVPEESVAVTRPQGAFHPMFALICTVALPYVMSAYVGVAEAAAELAKEHARKRAGDQATFYLLGEMHNQLVTAQLALDSLIELANDFDFEISVERASDAVVRKTLAAKACIAAVEKALEVTGGQGMFRALGLERLLRDVHGGQFHPMPEKQQQLFTARVLLGLPPIA